MPEITEETALLALGSNLGDREKYICRALDYIRGMAVAPVIESSIYNTPPVGPGEQHDYLNMCVSLRTGLTAKRLLAFCRDTEKCMGRLHRARWGPREIDIDILLYGNQVIKTRDLTVPHPELPNRQFVLVPLAEIAGGLLVPSLHMTVSQLLHKNISETGVERIVHHVIDKYTI